MEGNRGTKASSTMWILVLVVFLGIGVTTSIKKDGSTYIAQKNNNEILVATQSVENNEEYNVRNLRHINEYGEVQTRSASSSRFAEQIEKQKEEEERARIEAEEAARLAEEQRLEEERKEHIRNISISKDMDLTQRTGLTKEEFKMLIGNVRADSSKFFYNNSDKIYDVCEEYELNEIFFCGLISAESGWTIASAHRAKHNYISLMSNGGLIAYSSVDDGLETAARILHTKYLTPGGSFYYGKTLSAMRTRFCPVNPEWTNLVYGRMSQIYNSKNI